MHWVKIRSVPAATLSGHFLQKRHCRSSAALGPISDAMPETEMRLTSFVRLGGHQTDCRNSAIVRLFFAAE
jgi:hypothetical protein